MRKTPITPEQEASMRKLRDDGFALFEHREFTVNPGTVIMANPDGYYVAVLPDGTCDRPRRLP